MAPSALPASDKDIDTPIQEIIFSCSICQATPSEVYASVESDHGFQSGSGDHEGIVTKMWIASCSHVTCAKHLEGGAVPFHPANQPPQSSCPRCIKDHGDANPKELYGLRGLAPGDYDPIIPDEWLHCPPMKLDTTVPGMGAVRFQYVALSHYAREAKGHWARAEKKLSASQNAYAQERKSRKQAQTDLMEVKDRVQALEKADRQLKQWEARKPMIEHYLGSTEAMANELRVLRGQLRHLGYEVPEPEYNFDSRSGNDKITACDPNNAREVPREAHPASPVLLGPASQQVDLIESSSSGRKRKHAYLDNAPPYAGHVNAQQARQRVASRELMPPPLPRPHIARKQQSARYSTSQQPPASRLSTFGRDQVLPATSRGAAQAHNQKLAEHVNNRMQQDRPPRDAPAWLHSQPAADARHPTSHSVELSRRDEMRASEAQHTVDDTRTFSRLSINSPPKKWLNQDSQRGWDTARNAQTDPRRSDAGGRVLRYDSAYGSAARQPNYNLRNRATPSQHRISDPPANSVISPFFKRGSIAPRPQAVERSPSRASFARPTYHAPYNSAVEYQTQNRTSFTHRPHRPQSQLQQVPPQRYTNSPPYRTMQPVQMKQTPRDLERYVHQEPPLSRIPQASVIPNPRTSQQRISLPQANRRLAATQDDAVSQIHGVRGVSSRRGNATPQPPMFGSSLGLFSAGGGRRSIRR